MNRFKFETMKDQIVKVISEYLGKNTTVKYGFLKLPEKLEFNHSIQPGQIICQEIAAEIAGKVLAVVEQKTGWDDAPDWAMWLASNNKGLSQWFEDKPIWDDDFGFWDPSTEDGRYKFAGKLSKGKELIQRPK
jgi:hypothetical protein